MSNNEGRDRFKLAFEISPIILTGGIAEALPGGMMPIISLTQAADYNSLLGDVLQPFGSGGLPAGDLDAFFANFRPLPGGSLVDNEIGAYPFANQQVAANAIIFQPLRVSLLMNCPVRTPGGYQAKFTTFSNLKSQLDKHNAGGGTYSVATPSFLYTDCVLTKLLDVTSGDTKQPQSSWQFDFVQPLLTTAAARQAQNSLMQKITQGTALSGDAPAWSGQNAAVGNAGSGQGPPTIPAASNLVGASAGIPQSNPG